MSTQPHTMQPAMHTALSQLALGQHLGLSLTKEVFGVVMDGDASDIEIAALLTGLSVKGESVAEMVGAVNAMRARARPFAAPKGAVDLCGTGGDGHGTYNISTAAALVVAGCGVPVAKHGNRAVTSASGSSDILQELGVQTNVSAEIMESTLAQHHIAFLMAPLYHPAVKHVAHVRKALGFRTIFNVIGPLSNPANTKRQLIGVYDNSLLLPVAEALMALGLEHAWVVHGDDGLDEITTTTTTQVAEICDGEIHTFTLSPEDAGLPTATLGALKGGDARVNAHMLTRLLKGEKGPYRDIVLFNAAAMLVIAKQAEDIKDGIAYATKAIESGAAKHVLETLVECTKQADSA